jgi:hypothetical protein
MEIDIDDVTWKDDIVTAPGHREWRLGVAEGARLGRRHQRGIRPRSPAEAMKVPRFPDC